MFASAWLRGFLVGWLLYWFAMFSIRVWYDFDSREETIFERSARVLVQFMPSVRRNMT